MAVCVPSIAAPLLGQTGRLPRKLDDTSDRAFKDRFRAALGRTFEATISVSDVRLDGSQNLVLATPLTFAGSTESPTHPEAKDGFELVLSPTIVERLKNQGIENPQSEFKGRVVHARGIAVSVDVLTFPAMLIRRIIVKDAGDIEIVKD